jgi:hypothetical protein
MNDAETIGMKAGRATAFSLLVILWSAGIAHAQQATAGRTDGTTSTLAARDADATETPPAQTVRTLHGIYVRGGLGLGGLVNDVIGSEETADGELPEGMVSGMGMTGELTVSTPTSSQMVVGGGVWSSLVLTTEYTQLRGGGIPAGFRRPESITLAGVLAEWHFAPALGLYAQGGAGVGILSSRHFEAGEADGSTHALGSGLTLAIGADFWFEPRWALGAIARLTAAATTEEENDTDYVQGILAPALLLTIAYNE